MSKGTSFLDIHPEVGAALAENRPIVALESTLISHGFAYPRNREIAKSLEEEVRAAGGVPATIAVLDGRLRVGLDEAALELLATSGHVRKVSRRDLPVVVAQKAIGATTVAATMWIAHQAGIRVFATGGIGGVHRGHPFDVSADLPELARTPVCVVCAGAKSLLDLPLTLEWLETHGVTVIGYQTDEFPAFYSRSSGLPVDVCADGPEAVAAIVRARAELGLGGGVLVGVPVPDEAAMDANEAEAAIEAAVVAADQQNLRGAAVTPFLLAEISRRSGGASERANLALLRNNARVAANIASAW